MITVRITVIIDLTVVGSVSSTAWIPDIFLVKLRNPGNSVSEVRIGYCGRNIFRGSQVVSNSSLISPQDHVPWQQGSLHVFQRRANLAAR